MANKKKKKDLPLNGNKFKNALTRLMYMSDGEFSITRIFMVITFMSAIGLGLTGVISFLIWGKTIPDNIYTYIATLSGGGIVQYGLTKVVNRNSEEN